MDKNFSSRPSNLPPLWQAGLALATGCAIGLGVSHGLTKYLKRPASTKPVPATRLAQTKPVTQETTKAAFFDLTPKLEKRMNILLMGVDSNGRECERFKGCRSDTMILASVVPEEGKNSAKVNLISIPRDSRVRLANSQKIEKINSAHALGGPELAIKTVSEAFAVPIDHYMVIDVHGLKKTFEALGPVEILVEKNMRYQDHSARLNIALTPGINKLDANQVEEYVRFRHDPRGDIGRIERQQWFLRQVKKKFEEPDVLLKLPQLIKLANDYVRTDLSATDMLKLTALAKSLKPNQIQTAMMPGEAQTINGGSYWLPNPETSSLLLHRLAGAPHSVELIAANTGHFLTCPAKEGENGSQSQISNDTLNNRWAKALCDKPICVIIRYPRGLKEQARTLEARLTNAGIKVRYLQQGETSDCQHEQLIETSYRADEKLTGELKNKISELESYPVVVNLDPHASSDLTLVLAPDSRFQPLPTVAQDKNNAFLPAAMASTTGNLAPKCQAALPQRQTINQE
jgi:LCP family protein required for cell wall assembly